MRVSPLAANPTAPVVDGAAAFDVLYANGERVTECRYTERHALLGRLVHAGDTIQVAATRTVETPEELMTVFDAIGARLGGIVAKKLDLPYQAGARTYNWVKPKRVQAGHLRDAVDCVIIGYLYGRHLDAPCRSNRVS